MTNAIGTNQVLVNQNTNGSYQLSVVSYTLGVGTLEATSDKMYIGGMPLTVSKASNGLYVLSCIVDTSSPLTTTTTSIFGNLFSVVNGFLNVALQPLAYEQSQLYTYFKNLPIMLDSTHRICINQESGPAEQYSYTFLGGNPIKIARKGFNWYLVLNNNSDAQPSFLIGDGLGRLIDFGSSTFMTPF